MSLREEWPGLSVPEKSARVAEALEWRLVAWTKSEDGFEQRCQRAQSAGDLYPDEEFVEWSQFDPAILRGVSLPPVGSWALAGALLDKLRGEGWLYSLSSNGLKNTPWCWLTRSNGPGGVDAGDVTLPGAIALTFCLAKEVIDAPA